MPRRQASSGSAMPAASGAGSDGLDTSSAAAGAAGGGKDSRGPSADVSFVSYNVLSSHLSEPSHPPFRLRDPADLDPDTRFDRLLTKLEPHVKRGAVIALQELSRDWAGRLHVFFRGQGYTMVNSQYGNPFNGYMGVGLAYPDDGFELMEVREKRISDTKRWPRAPPPGVLEQAWNMATAVPLGVWNGAWGGVKRATPGFVWSGLRAAVGACKRAVGPDVWDSVRIGGDPSEDIWVASKRRFNAAVLMRLRDRGTGARFAVGTYHMPCAFRTMPLMVVHASLVAQYVQTVAGDDPHVLLGDFNFKPHSDSSCYKLLTTGKLETGHPDYPHPRPYDSWRPDLALPYVSAYAAASDDGSTEPEFTNYVTMPDGEEFCETLDYVFHSSDVETVEVLPLPPKAEAPPMPWADEPSDHLLIGATLRIPGVKPETEAEGGQGADSADDADGR